MIIGPNLEALSLPETVLSCIYHGEILTSQNAVEGINTILKRGNPESIFIAMTNLEEDDSNFYRYLENENIQTPLIVFTSGPEDKKNSSYYPLVTSFVDMPIGPENFIKLINKILPVPLSQKKYIPIKTNVLLRLGVGHFDLFLKLSEQNYVRIIHKGEPFYEADAVKLSDKGIFELYIRSDEGQDILAILEKDFSSLSNTVPEEITKTIDHVQTFEAVARALGWSPTVLHAAQKSVSQAVKILSRNSNVIKTLKEKNKDESSHYANHIGLLSYLVCAFSSSLGWIGEAGQVKLAMAALVHDVAVDESYYKNIYEWNKKAADPTDKSPETIRYRMHPYEASKLIRSQDYFSMDVDQIILQHHEIKDGTGFPRGLDARRIGHLPALFIIVEDLVDFVQKGTSIETSVIDFITWGQERYDSGQFKKIFQSFMEKLKF